MTNNLHLRRTLASSIVFHPLTYTYCTKAEYSHSVTDIQNDQIEQRNMPIAPMVPVQGPYLLQLELAYVGYQFTMKESGEHSA